MSSSRSRQAGTPRPIDFLMAARFFAHVPFYLRRPLSLEQARSIQRERLRNREAIFLAQVRRTIYDYPASPYLPLLERAGAEHGDLERSVREKGIEGTLQDLFREGVYLTVDEFKGRKDIVRGSTTVETGPERLRNLRAAYHLPASSGGSRSRGTPVFMDLRFIRGCAVDCALYLDAWGGSDWLKSTWEVPGAGARFRLMKYAGFGMMPVRWFSQVDPDDPALNPIFRWNMLAIFWASRIGGKPLPRAVHAPVPAPDPVAEWFAEVLRRGQVPHMLTFPSSAVALCQRAAEQGIDIRGARLTIGGEPITRAKLAVIRDAGCEALPRYGSMECGPIGYGCMNPQRPDEVHLVNDLDAVILAGEEGMVAGLPPKAILITSLHPYAPFTLLNVSMGDEATLSERSCGCPLEQLGWRRHLSDIRSYEKLTGGGMTFFGSDVIRVLEEVMPSCFGGSPTDYQLVEEESGDGRSVVKLAINPALGPLNSDEAADVFLSALGSSSVTNQVMEQMWRESRILEVVRQKPATTHSGKVLHLYVRPSERD